LARDLGVSPSSKSPPRLGDYRGLKSAIKLSLRDVDSNALSMTQMKKISIHFFGIQRLATKTDSIDMPITETTSVSDVLEYILKRYPDIPLNKKAVLVTVNQEMASFETRLKENDVVLFIPFVGGG